MYSDGPGKPPLPTRLMAGASILEHIHNLSDEALVHRWVKSPLEAWQVEIGRMWRFSRSNGITEGYHRKMKLIQRRAFGFCNFENYRRRVRALCA